MWARAPHCILLLDKWAQSGLGKSRSPQPSLLPSVFSGVMVHWFIFGFRWVSASPPPGHTSGLQADTGWAQAFPPGYSASQESWMRESRLEGGKARAEVSHGTNTSRHLSLFPSVLCFSLEWFIPCLSKGRAFARSLHCTLSLFPIPQPINYIGKLFSFCKLSHFRV